MANTDPISTSNTSSDNIETTILQGNTEPISLRDVQEEFLDIGSASLTEFYGADRNVPSRGNPISLSDFYGAENIHVWYFGGNPEEEPAGYPSGRLPGPNDFGSFTGAGSFRTYQTSNYNILQNAYAQGWNGFSELRIVIPSDIIIYGTSITQPAIRIDKTWNNPNGGPAWVNPITLDIRGVILGKGGQGGGDGATGQNGGDAILVNAGRQIQADADSVLPPVVLFNSGFILAGGGGGGGSPVERGGGGGGGAGGGNGRAYNGAGGGQGAGTITGSNVTRLRGSNGRGNEPGLGGYAGGGGGGRRTRNKATPVYGGGGGGGRDWRQGASGGTGDNNGGGNGGAWSGTGGNGGETGGGGGWGQRGGRSNRISGQPFSAGGLAVRISGTGADVTVRDLGGVRLGTA